MRETATVPLSRPSLVVRLLMVFCRLPPRRVRLGFMFGSARPGQPICLQSAEATALVPWETEEIVLDFEVFVDGQEVRFVDPWVVL